MRRGGFEVMSSYRSNRSEGESLRSDIRSFEVVDKSARRTHPSVLGFSLQIEQAFLEYSNKLASRRNSRGILLSRIQKVAQSALGIEGECRMIQT